MTKRTYIKLIPLAPGEPVEVGPFSHFLVVRHDLFIEDQGVPCAHLCLDGDWHVDRGAALGDPGLTGAHFQIILGQAK